MKKSRKFRKLPEVNVIDLGNLSEERYGLYDLRFNTLREMFNDMIEWQPKEIFKWDIPEKMEIGFGYQSENKEIIVRWSIDYRTFIFEKDKMQTIFNNTKSLINLIHEHKTKLIKSKINLFPIEIMSF